jgi:two-component system response regulator WspF
MRVAIVNDLGLARQVLRQLVLSVQGNAVAWTANDGAEAVRLAAQDRPDVILMDLLMPVMDGVEATQQIMAANPCPILVVTSTVAGNIGKVYEAMGHGALDAVNTPTLGPGGKVKDGDGLLSRLARLRQLMRSEPCLPAAAVTGRSAAPGSNPPAVPVVALGASTGGPEALGQILGALPARWPTAVLVVQHIAAEFTPSLATWLQGRTALPVRVARAGDEPRAGEILLACTDDHLLLRPDRRLAYVTEPVDYPYRPSVDVLFGSLAAHWGRPGVAALLTGMGNDGARGLTQLKQAGWWTLAQDEASCVVYGMPKAAAACGAACRVLPLEAIGRALQERVTQLSTDGPPRRQSG